MNDKLRTTILVLVSLIILFLVFTLVPSKGPQLQGQIVQQPITQQPTSISSEIPLLSSGRNDLVGSIDLSDWKSFEIAEAISLRNNRLNPTAYNFRYDEKCNFYSQYGEIFGQDSFCNLKYSYFGQEWDEGHLRIDHLDYEISESAIDKYNVYFDNVLKETQLDPDLECFTQKECNDINVIVCSKNSNNYYSWFEGKVLMSSINDGRRNLDAFTSFYCKTELKPLTGSIVSPLIDNELIINKIANFIKKLT